MTFEESQQETIRALQALSSVRPQIDRAGQMILGALQAGRKLLLCGNGGSAAEAQHFATELRGRYSRKRRSLPAIALAADASLVTCVGNDFGFEQLFAHQLAGLAQTGDVVIVLSSSGNSANLLAALAEAKRLGLATIALLGRNGGQARGMADCEIIVPGPGAAAAQECHLFLIHHFCELVDAAVG